MREGPYLRWFEENPPCYICGKKSAGILRGHRNDSYGPHCKTCASKRLRDSKKVREAEKAAESLPGPVATVTGDDEW